MAVLLNIILGPKTDNHRKYIIIKLYYELKYNNNLIK